MKTKPTPMNVCSHIFCCLLFLLMSFYATAQCPTITDPNPPPICDASGYTFNDLNALATDNGNGIVWYDVASGGTPFNVNELVSEGTYYADDNSGTCGVRASITIDFQVDPSGENLDRIYCSNESATIQTYIDDVLLGSIPSGGAVEVYNDFDLTDQANPTDAIPIGASNYYIVFVDNGGCKSQIEIGQVGVFSAPTDPTPASPQEFCSDSNPLVGNLDPGTTSTNFLWYSSLDGSGDPIPPALALTEPLVDGNTYYVQIDDIFCVSNPVAVTVNIDTPVEAGSSANLEYCNDNLPGADFDLFDELGGTPDNTGTWTGPLATSNGFRGTVNISSLTTAGTYTFTYTVASTGACPDAVATVSIEVYETLSSGTPSAANPASYCESGLPTDLDLFSLLDSEDPGGQWTQGTLSTDPVVTSPFDLTGFTSGTYNFTYTQNLLPNPCPEESTTVQVVVLADPDAGNAVNQTFCENDLATNSPFNLFDALDGSQDNNSGTWTDAANATVSNPIDITGFTVAGSPYLFTYTIDNGTCSDSEQISITIEDAPESGTPVATFPEFCEGTAPASFDLFDLLNGEDQTGTWYVGTDNTGATTPNPIDLSSLTPGTYDYTFDVDAIGSCDDPLVTVQITINPLPNTGTPSPATFCENDLAANSPLDLFGQLAGEDSGGTWTDDDTSGALSGSNLDLTALTIGSFNFTYTITDVNGCTNSSTVTITVEDAPESGTPVATFPEFCEGTAPASFDLFDLLNGEDQTGTWYVGTDNTGATTPNPIDLSSLTPGTYDYTFDVDAIGSCDDPLVTVQITINPLPNTGTPSPATFCENDLAANSPLDLFGQLAGEDSGGTWADDDTSGALSGSNVDLTALAIGSYNFTYSITDSNGCTNSSTVTITVEDAPESGTANTPVEFCISEITTAQTYNLFDLLTDEDQTGTWNDDDATGALSGNLVTIDGLASGTYDFTYDVDAIGSCDDVNVTVSIIINDTPAPTASATQEFCDSATIGDLSATGTTIQWYDDATGGTALDGTTALVDGEDYYATQTDGTTNCESSTRTQVDVTIYQSPDAGNPNTTAIVACNDNNNIDLFTGLDGTEDTGGTWQDDDATGALTGNIFDASGLAPGTYDFTYLVSANAPCVDDSTTITVTIEEPQNAGTDATLDICSTDTVTDLFSLLGGADAGGSWSPALASGTGDFDPTTDTSGTYTYTITNACGTVSSDVVVTVIEAPNAGANASLAACAGDGTTDLFTLLGVDAQTGGTWSPALTSGTGVFDPSMDTAGTYTYTVTAIAPCSPDATADVTVTIDDSLPVVVLDPNPTFCLADAPTVADLSDSIRATGTVNWYEDAALTMPLSDTDNIVDGEDYYATQTNSTGCESSVAVQIDVTVNDAATPTLDDFNEDYCINDGPTLNTLSQNIVEYDAALDNIVWYDVPIGGVPIPDTSALGNTTYYAALVDQTTGCESSVRLEVTPDITACGKISLPDGFSPNGDGMNDTYDIDNLDILYPNFELEIYNRNGNIVYKGNASTPRFDGTSNQGRVVVKGDLPVGVYFYIFRFNNGVDAPEQGRLYLSR
ncbi:gliding motility-associated C-terminal domain-containing protein [Hyunsoonleella flava]|uniref:Gliding motility-associated C-terminal domain-containing protein n=1 Tax=Hyunsoonleella flava TaxID=2527939 RepID=A0A4Q9FB15_9FLAO|nr:gliding motility-associated C-terminal domain-containing protein [Hyunsoonleella flava]TBN01812.1 gliding motility-associated C-terminal domain-containing protein [Hyunsoonleella flava]